MTVVGAEAVDAAAGAGILTVAPRDVITPLARERARERGVQIVVATPGTTAAGTQGRSAGAARPVPGQAIASVPQPGPAPRVATPSVPPPRPAPARPRPSPAGAKPATVTGRSGSAPGPIRPPSGALHRRGAPLPPAVRPGAFRRVVVVGAGNVGTVTAMRLADADVFGEVVLVDVDEGRARGVALDLAHSAALGGFATRVRGTGTVEDAGTADYVVITAGRARQPGMSRSDLVGTNAAIVGDVAGRVARTSPDAVIVVVTNPLDEMTQHAWQASGFPAERVVGMAGVLDTARFQALAAPATDDRPDRIRALALGSHGEEMVIPLSQATLGGSPLTETVDPPELEAVVDRARASGAEVVGLLRSGSAFLAPGTAAASMVLAMARDSGEVLPASVLADGTYGIRDVYVGLPVRLGRHGVRQIVEVDLAPDELGALRAAADRIRERVGTLAASTGSGSP
jgi:malate dehydrogenase